MLLHVASIFHAFLVLIFIRGPPLRGGQSLVLSHKTENQQNLYTELTNIFFQKILSRLLCLRLDSVDSAKRPGRDESVATSVRVRTHEHVPMSEDQK